jgi:hypothetical protein
MYTIGGWGGQENVATINHDHFYLFFREIHCGETHYQEEHVSVVQSNEPFKCIPRTVLDVDGKGFTRPT